MRTQLARHRPTKVSTEKTGLRYLVVGGHGFLGSHLVEGLLARGETDVRVFDRAPSSLFAEEAGRGVVTVLAGDLSDAAALRQACRGVDVVFHTAAAVNYWSNLPFEYEAIHATNVTGTENVIAACVAEGVGKLLHTSSTSVVVGHDLLDRPLTFADESAPYATPPYLCHYVATKVLAERAVLAAHGRGGLLTAALRPGGMYGPRDQLLAAAARAGKPGVGLADNVIDHVYVENVVHAFLLLEPRLVAGAAVGGQAYFITNYPPSSDGGRCDSYHEFNRRLAAAFGHRFKLAPAWIITALSWASQTAVWASRGGAARHLGDLAKLRPPSLTLARGTYYFSCRKAHADFGYQPLYTVDEALALTAQ